MLVSAEYIRQANENEGREKLSSHAGFPRSIILSTTMPDELAWMLFEKKHTLF
jgi:hypothetical protein